MGENPRGPTGPWPSRPTRLPPWPTYPTTPNPNPTCPPRSPSPPPSRWIGIGPDPVAPDALRLPVAVHHRPRSPPASPPRPLPQRPPRRSTSPPRPRHRRPLRRQPRLHRRPPSSPSSSSTPAALVPTTRGEALGLFPSVLRPCTLHPRPPAPLARGLRRRRLPAHARGAYLTVTPPPASSSSSSTRCRLPSSPPQRRRPASSSSPAVASRRLRPRHRSSRPRAPAPPRAHF